MVDKFAEIEISMIPHEDDGIKNNIRRALLPAETRKLFLNAVMEEEFLEYSEIMEVCHTVLLYLQNSNG